MTARKPASFAMPSSRPPAEMKSEPVRLPAALEAASPLIVIEDSHDVLDEVADLQPAPAAPIKRGWSATGIFVSAVGLIATIAIGLWTNALIAQMFSRADWLGWTGVALVAIAIVTFAIIVAREWRALSRLDTVSRNRELAADAYENNDEAKARVIVEKLGNLLKSQPETALGRKTLDETKGEIVDGRDLVRIAETGLLAPLDARATTLIMNAAKRVSVVTAVSPRALVDVGYILFEAFRLIRQLCELYGHRPATLGLLRLARDVVAHLAVTGSVAMGDSLIQQMLGHGIAAKLSARLGEGVINGLMTARIGIAAMDLVRPLPFNAQKRPGISDFLGELVKFGAVKTEK